ncbi:hypothetical protein LZG75_11970 [Polynucleobacter sp. IMCC30063]|uniref:hypothetical protein n=1 Tax=Polynucleobacter sp. IMCC30063 TaxID=2907298 RepID=UPI001F46D5F5|nr:hypothetical protein [Polynucleobacter sp. IMCC30063]MCE7506946.1 hypothetical protein [Polynucleobacter sp. IMCC30063]
MTAFFRSLFLCAVLLLTASCSSLLAPFFPGYTATDKKNTQTPLKPFTFNDWAYLVDSANLEWFYDPTTLEQDDEGVISLEVITKPKGKPWPKIGIPPNAKETALDAPPVGISHPANPPEFIEAIVEPKLDPKQEQKLFPLTDMGSNQMAEKITDPKLNLKPVKKVVPIIFLQPALIEIDCALNVFKAQISEVYAPSIPFVPVIPGERLSTAPSLIPEISSSLSDIGVSKGEWKDIKGSTAMHWIKARLCGRTIFGNLTRYYFLYQDPPPINPPFKPQLKIPTSAGVFGPLKLYPFLEFNSLYQSVKLKPSLPQPIVFNPLYKPINLGPPPPPPPVVFDILYKQLVADKKTGNKEMRLISYKLDTLLSDEILWTYRADCQNKKYQLNKLNEAITGQWLPIGNAISFSGVAFNRACGKHGDYMNTVNEFTK